jgi:hypothetical protein
MVTGGLLMVAPEALTKFAQDIFTGAGLPPKDADAVGVAVPPGM